MNMINAGKVGQIRSGEKKTAGENSVCREDWKFLMALGVDTVAFHF